VEQDGDGRQCFAADGEVDVARYLRGKDAPRDLRFRRELRSERFCDSLPGNDCRYRSCLPGWRHASGPMLFGNAPGRAGFGRLICVLSSLDR